MGVQLPSLALHYMPEFLQIKFYGNTAIQWAISFILILSSILVARVVNWFFTSFLKRVAGRTKSKWDDILVVNIKEPLTLALALVGIRFSLNYLDLPEKGDLWINRIYHILFVLNASWFLSRIMDAVFVEVILPIAEKTETELDDLIVPLLKRGLKFIVWTLGIIIGLNNAGYDVGALIAGLGIGGVALAFAARATLSNIFGGLSIFVDQPFSINDRIRIRGRTRGLEGYVKEVGLRMTTLITREGTELIVPNSLFSSEAVENISREPSSRVLNFFKLDKDNSSELVQNALDLLKEIAKKNSGVDTKQPIIANLQSIENNYLGILYIYFVKKDSDDNFVQTEMNLEILKIFREHGILWSKVQPTEDQFFTED
ncbi:MAG: mechanosensitive ion channel family protein [Leptospiraceae bacterium]|nr:mechanosensitive ion channel family protein [Leptospiraceae bacterium]